MGWAGVPVFFVVSGFCIHLSFQKKACWRTFWIRRFCRIYPPYAVAVLFFAFVTPWTRSLFWSDLGTQLWSHLALVHNFSDLTFFGFNSSFWSIALEFQLYLLYPVLLWMATRRGWRWSLGALAIIEVSLRAAWGWHGLVGPVELPHWLFGFPLLHWFSWSIGAAVADAFLRKTPIPFARHSWKLWLATAVVCCLSRPLTNLAFVFFALATASYIAKRLTSPASSRGTRNAWTRHLQDTGRWSYSLYLFHQPLLVLAPMAAVAVRPAGVLPIVTFGVCLMLWWPMRWIAATLFHVLELPSMKFGHWWLKRSSLHSPENLDDRRTPSARPA
jgi:peptidoglycan/LPS O-acetylase OafA/YrhL